MSFFSKKTPTIEQPAPSKESPSPRDELDDETAFEVDYQELKVLEAELDAAVVKAEATGDFDEAIDLKSAMEKKVHLAQERHDPFRELLHLQEQYDTQKNILKEAGLLKELKNGELGITGIDGHDYPFPTMEAINARLKEKKDLYKTKINQGFSQLLIVPFGMSLDKLVAKTKEVILKHHEAGQLFATKKDPNDPDEALVPLELNEQQEPLWVWNEWAGSDINGKCVYYPQALTEKNHHGQTKTAILKKQQKDNLTLKGWDVSLVEASVNIPKAGQGQTMNGRKQLEANQKPEQYLKQLQTKSEYQNEQGLTNEAWLTLLITHLEKTNQVIDDWQGNGKVCYLPGSFLPSSRGLGYGYWGRGNRQASLSRTDAGGVDSGCGFRSAVGI